MVPNPGTHATEGRRQGGKARGWGYSVLLWAAPRAAGVHTRVRSFPPQGDQSQQHHANVSHGEGACPPGEWGQCCGVADVGPE